MERRTELGAIEAEDTILIRIKLKGDGFTWLSENIEKDIALAQEAWQLAREKIAGRVLLLEFRRGAEDQGPEVEEAFRGVREGVTEW